MWTLLLACETADVPTAPTQVLLPPVDEVYATAHGRFDRDRDGLLSSSEFTRGATRDSSGLPLGEVDTDGDGGLSVDEFRRLIETREPRPLIDKTKSANPGAPKEFFREVLRPARTPGDRAAPREGLPNILLISMDEVRADHLSIYGYEDDTTPFLHRFAAHGAVFENVSSTGNESAYSHAAMLTGRYPSEVARPEYLRYQVPEDAQLVGEILKLYGYETGAFLAGGHIRHEFGFDQGWDTFSDELGFASFWHTTPKALDWLDGRDGAAPWFLMVHGYDAHRSWLLPDPFFHRFTDGQGSDTAERIVRNASRAERIFDGVYYPDFELEKTQHPSGVYILTPASYQRLAEQSGGHGQRLTSDDVEHIRGHYDAMLGYLDLQLALFLSAAEASGHLDNTIVILTSDHGEDLLDHGYINHRTGLTKSCTGVPLVIVGPGIERGQRIDEPVDIVDLVPTILARAGAEPPAGLPGRDLWPAVTDGSIEPKPSFLEGVSKQIGVRTATHTLLYSGVPLVDPDYVQKLVDAPDEAFVLYDLRTDPNELVDVRATQAATFQELRTTLTAWRAGLTRGEHGMDPSSLPEHIRKEMQDKGYWEFGEAAPD
ncbi:MAG: sulfatase-like hydrolase/transferase [Proteobacteria bacterium]|nr:sulfatase-like hydrolase/transferase [Pseudomonadota bacterium]MCP4921582.1 sulfatase-like hydrolase/transferase [Pseudomonadota bacterium]